MHLVLQTDAELQKRRNQQPVRIPHYESQKSHPLHRDLETSHHNGVRPGRVRIRAAAGPGHGRAYQLPTVHRPQPDHWRKQVLRSRPEDLRGRRVSGQLGREAVASCPMLQDGIVSFGHFSGK